LLAIGLLVNVFASRAMVVNRRGLPPQLNRYRAIRLDLTAQVADTTRSHETTSSA
jgi:hypothetical protein